MTQDKHETIIFLLIFTLTYNSGCHDRSITEKKRNAMIVFVLTTDQPNLFEKQTEQREKIYFAD